jgi:hypothetical protein
MFDYMVKSDEGESQRVAVALRRGVAVLLVLGGMFSLAVGVTALGLANLTCGMALGVAELRRSLREKAAQR